MKIGDYMSSPVLSVDLETNVQEASKIMDSKKAGSLLITESGEYVGIITESDMTRKVLGGKLDPETTLVSQIMSQPVLTLDRSMTIYEANDFMRDNKIRHLAVTEDEKIVGMLSIRDVVGFWRSVDTEGY
ncbi:MAG: cyclic nucleotide-binding/CBS domain-containing protein [Nitrospinales bacterium]